MSLELKGPRVSSTWALKHNTLKKCWSGEWASATPCKLKVLSRASRLWMNDEIHNSFIKVGSPQKSSLAEQLPFLLGKQMKPGVSKGQWSKVSKWWLHKWAYSDAYSSFKCNSFSWGTHPVERLWWCTHKRRPERTCRIFVNVIVDWIWLRDDWQKSFQPFPFFHFVIIIHVPVTSSHKCHIHLLWRDHPWLAGWLKKCGLIWNLVSVKQWAWWKERMVEASW